MIYLASPYSHEDKEIRVERHHAVCEEMVAMISRGVHVFSPIAHSHYTATAFDLPSDWEYWSLIDRAFIQLSTEVYVLKLDGWESSRGVQAEIEYARKLGKPITFLKPFGQ